MVRSRSDMVDPIKIAREFMFHAGSVEPIPYALSRVSNFVHSKCATERRKYSKAIIKIESCKIKLTTQKSYSISITHRVVMTVSIISGRSQRKTHRLQACRLGQTDKLYQRIARAGYSHHQTASG